MSGERTKIRWGQPFSPFTKEGVFKASLPLSDLSGEEAFLPINFSALASHGPYSLPGFCFLQAGASMADFAEAGLLFRRLFFNRAAKAVDHGYQIDPGCKSFVEKLVVQMRLPGGGCFLARPFGSRLHDRGEMRLLFWPDQKTLQAAGRRNSSLNPLRVGLPFLIDPLVDPEERIRVSELQTVIPVARNDPGYLSQVEMTALLRPPHKAPLIQEGPWDQYETLNHDMLKGEVGGYSNAKLMGDYKKIAGNVSRQSVTMGDLEQMRGILASQGEPVSLDNLTYYTMAVSISRLKALEDELVRRSRVPSGMVPPETPLV